MFDSLYNLIITFLWFLVRLVGLFDPKTRRWVAGQNQSKQWLHQIAQQKREKKLTIWCHVASLGEFEQGRPVLEKIRQQYPNAFLVLTFFSPSGYELRKNYDQVDTVGYLPVDTAANAKSFLNTIQPDLALFVKYEFWYNYLHQLHQRQIPTVLFSAIFRPQQLFFQWYGGFFRQILFCFEHIVVQNETSQALLASVGYHSTTVAGDTRLDRVAQIAAQAQAYPLIEIFKNKQPLLVIGSAWPDDMAVLVPFLQIWSQPLKVIIAPHEINQEQMTKWEHQLGNTIRYTSLSPSYPTLLLQNTRFLFLDTVGMLSSVYRYADFAYIGGAFGDGLHNILEPAVFGMPIFFGKPHFTKFQEAHDLLALGGTVAIGSTSDFENAFGEVYQNEKLKNRKSQICRQYIQNNRGATDAVMKVINSLIVCV
ncbi:MAG: 3-deoxy-D-manno-octulosonic acid transferase [Runella sp.]